MKKLCATLLGVGVAITTAVLGPPAAADTIRPELRGSISRTDGSPFAAGSKVAVFAIERSRDSAPGATSMSVPVASGTVGAGGAFAVSLRDLATLERLADHSGVIDLEIRALDGSAFAPYAISRRIVREGSSVTLADPTAEDAVGRGRRSTAEAVHITASASVAAAASVGMQPTDARAEGLVPFTQVCGETKTKNLGTRRVLVGATYATASYTNAHFTYNRGASSSIGVVYSANAKKGSWSKAGSVSRASTSSIDYGNRYRGTAYYTYFTFGQFAQWCRPIGSSQNRVYNHVVKATGYAGGSFVASAPVPAANRCTPFANNTIITTATTAANTWEQAVNFLGPLGVTLSAKTGWSSAASMSYTNKSGRTKRICGTKGYWGAAPERAVTK